MIFQTSSIPLQHHKASSIRIMKAHGSCINEKKRREEKKKENGKVRQFYFLLFISSSSLLTLTLFFILSFLFSYFLSSSFYVDLIDVRVCVTSYLWYCVRVVKPYEWW